MESLEVEYVGPEDINENSEYDALNDETFGNAEDTGDGKWMCQFFFCIIMEM